MTDVLTRPEIATAATRRSGRGAGPDFICVGAQKAGSRWLYDQLAFHPEFWMPPVKELHYFDDARPGFRKATRLQARIERDLASLNRNRMADSSPTLTERDLRFVRAYLDFWQHKGAGVDGYARLFDDKGPQRTGDVTPAYSCLAEPDIRAIVERFPDLKVVFIAREPIERFWSALGMAARQTKSRIKIPLTPASMLNYLKRKNVSGRSYPSQTIARWKKVAGEGQFAFFFFDDLRSDPADLRARVLRFLDADPALQSGELDPGFNRKSKSAKLQLTDELRDALVGHFAEEIRICAETLGGRAVEWRKKYNL